MQMPHKQLLVPFVATETPQSFPAQMVWGFKDLKSKNGALKYNRADGIHQCEYCDTSKFRAPFKIKCVFLLPLRRVAVLWGAVGLQKQDLVKLQGEKFSVGGIQKLPHLPPLIHRQLFFKLFGKPGERVLRSDS